MRCRPPTLRTPLSAPTLRTLARRIERWGSSAFYAKWVGGQRAAEDDFFYAADQRSMFKDVVRRVLERRSGSLATVEQEEQD